MTEDTSEIESVILSLEKHDHRLRMLEDQFLELNVNLRGLIQIAKVGIGIVCLLFGLDSTMIAEL